MRSTFLVDVSPDNRKVKPPKPKRVTRVNIQDAIKVALGSRLFVLDKIQGEETPNGVEVFQATRYDRGRIQESYLIAAAKINPETGLLLSSGRLVETK
ncbi:MAG: hypothetical protein IT565_14245 [Rhodospirillales bacterium]|nr:hypothetical protein [Rhodospirillales bacterium]